MTAVSVAEFEASSVDLKMVSMKAVNVCIIPPTLCNLRGCCNSQLHSDITDSLRQDIKLHQEIYLQTDKEIKGLIAQN